MPGGGRLTRLDTRQVASAAVFTAFVAAATSLFAVFLPLGYFNVGEIMVYTAAILMGPYVGAFAGGVGSMLSDLSLGFANYAPGTLVIKGLEGLIVGYLARARTSPLAPRSRLALTLAAGGAFSGMLAAVGGLYLSGSTTVTLGGAWYVPAATLTLQVPWEAWAAAGGVAFVAIAYAGLKTELGVGLVVLSVLAGGAEMVAGYFLYETFVLQLGSYPPTEVPFNVAQALVGLMVSVPLVRSIRRAFGARGVGGR